MRGAGGFVCRGGFLGEVMFWGRLGLGGGCGSQSSLPPVSDVLLQIVLMQQWQQKSRLGPVAKPLLVEDEGRFTCSP